MSKYEAIIGLEVHSQLLTESKIFCSCSTRFGEKPNTNTCPVCIGMPGVLPVLNKKVVDFGIKLGLATNCKIARTNIFARKNYFYPDLPKGYQITQYENPLCERGYLDIEVNGRAKRIGITRIHMEEDAGKSIHEGKRSLIDFNRSGVPLLEIVSDPDLRNTEETVSYLKELRQVLVYLEICDGNMEEGSFRCDANISVRPNGSDIFGTRTEIKNMNSFRNVQRALDFEIKRHIEILESGNKVIQETRLWDDTSNITRSMRTKEESHDYRYFPEPDLVPVIIDDAWNREIEKTLPELPRAKRLRFVEEYGLPVYDAEVLTQTKELANCFEESVSECNKHMNNPPTPKEISNWIMTEVLRRSKEGKIPELTLIPEMLIPIFTLMKKGTISGNIAKDVFQEMLETVMGEGKSAKDMVKSVEDMVKMRGLEQISDENVLKNIVQEIVRNNPKEVAAYKKGKTQLLAFFIGQVMKLTSGKANPGLTAKLIKEALEK